MSTELGNTLYSSYIVSVMYPRRSRIPLSRIKVINGSCLEISVKDPIVEKFGLIANGYSKSAERHSLLKILSISSFSDSIS